MKTVAISQSQINRAKELYDFTVLNNSITQGTSNIYGALGEVIVLDYFSILHSVEYIGDYDYDLTIDGYKVEVKTKRTTAIPKSHYNCSIANYNTTQKCDFYMFVRIMVDLTKGFILGYIRRNELNDISFFKKKGEEDDGFTFKADCYNIKIGQLRML